MASMRLSSCPLVPVMAGDVELTRNFGFSPHGSKIIFKYTRLGKVIGYHANPSLHTSSLNVAIQKKLETFSRPTEENAFMNKLQEAGNNVSLAVSYPEKRIWEPSARGCEWVTMKAQDLDRESFAPFGDVLNPVEEESPHGSQDAVVSLMNGIPRLYVMKLRKRRLQFDRLTHHAAVTQTLGALHSFGEPWYLAVAPRSMVAEAEDTEGHACGIVKSKAGHSYYIPKLEDVRVFRIEGSQMVNLHVGTWHQGPFFKPPSMDFYNLELSNTGEVDHTCHGFGGIKVEIVD